MYALRAVISYRPFSFPPAMMQNQRLLGTITILAANIRVVPSEVSACSALRRISNKQQIPRPLPALETPAFLLYGGADDPWKYTFSLLKSFAGTWAPISGASLKAISAQIVPPVCLRMVKLGLLLWY